MQYVCIFMYAVCACSMCMSPHITLAFHQANCDPKIVEACHQKTSHLEAGYRKMEAAHRTQLDTAATAANNLRAQLNRQEDDLRDARGKLEAKQALDEKIESKNSKLTEARGSYPHVTTREPSTPPESTLRIS